MVAEKLRVDIMLASRWNEVRNKNDQLEAAKLNVRELKQKIKEMDTELKMVKSQKISEGKAADSRLTMAEKQSKQKLKDMDMTGWRWRRQSGIGWRRRSTLCPAFLRAKR